MKDSQVFIIDFDSTIVQVEALDELAAIALHGNSERDAIVEKIRAITARGMDGSMPISKSLRERLALIRPSRQHIDKLIKLLKRRISPAFKRNKKFLKKYAKQIYVITAGFKEYVVPVCRELGIRPDHVFANSFVFGADGCVSGLDSSNPLAHDKGKVQQIKQLAPQGEVFVIGDGMTDWEITESGYVKEFVAYTENVRREAVVAKADRVIKSLDELLYEKHLPMNLSYPKSKIQVLLLEAIHPDAVAAFKDSGFSVELVPDALDEEKLSKALKNTAVLGIRSKTRITAGALSHAPRLLTVGAFCIGTEQIDLNSCTERGVAVFNAPFSNTRSVVELAFGEIIMLLRRTFEASSAMHVGRWIKSASGCNEVRGKKLGIVGYGNIGSQLSVLAESFGMEVYYYDVTEKLALGNARKCRSLAELLGLVDIVTLHVDGRAANKNLIGARELKQIKKGAVLLNLSRGHIVDIAALAEALRGGRLAGAAVDVFPHEPHSNKEEFVSELRGLPNVILTPHVGGSTAEAQRAIGQYVAQRLIEYIDSGSTFGSVNFPQIQLSMVQRAHRLLHIHRNVPGILAKINSTLAKGKINILGQYLKTNEQIGYVITDVNKKYNEQIMSQLKSIDETIKFRVLY